MKSDESKASKSTMRLRTMMLTLLIVGSGIGCASVKVISSDRAVQRLKATVPFTPERDGWFVPDATWKDLNEALADKLPTK